MEREELREQPIGDLVQQASRQTADLVRQEIRLSQAEMQQKAKRAGLGGGLVGGAGLMAFFGGAALVACVIMLIGLALEPWLGALVVGVALIAVAGVAALTGKQQVTKAAPPQPEQAMASVRDDIGHVKEEAAR